MGCCNEPAIALIGSAPDPARHVNYAKGMVLGVDDFTQEFAYLAGRDQWLARDAIGYGTLSGLKVYPEDGGADGPRLHVAAGSALAVSGRLICVPADQCCLLNKWLAKPENAATVNRLLGGGSPPMSPPLSPPATSGTISLYLTLCYADCLTAPVPIPGEPCRSEDQLMAPSRVADDFCLELRAEAPPQIEEDALRDFVKWLKDNVQVVDTGSPPAGDDASWLAALRGAVQTWLDAMKASPPSSPPSSPPAPVPALGDYLAGLLPLNLTVASDQLCNFLRVAFRFWVTELRPWVTELRSPLTEPRPRRCQPLVDKDRDCVLLARVEFPVVWVGGSPTGLWEVGGSPSNVGVDESARPFIVHLRLLQEWMLCGCECVGGAASGAMGGPPATPMFARAPARASPPSIPGAGPAATAPSSAASQSVPITSIGTTVAVTLDASHYCVICDGGQTLNLPKVTARNRGRVYVVKTLKSKSTLNATRPDQIEGAASLAVKKSGAVTVVSDGSGNWLVIGSTA
jgi:hypothetical protein